MSVNIFDEFHNLHAIDLHGHPSHMIVIFINYPGYWKFLGRLVIKWPTNASVDASSALQVPLQGPSV